MEENIQEINKKGERKRKKKRERGEPYHLFLSLSSLTFSFIIQYAFPIKTQGRRRERESLPPSLSLPSLSLFSLKVSFIKVEKLCGHILCLGIFLGFFFSIMWWGIELERDQKYFLIVTTPHRVIFLITFDIFTSFLLYMGLCAPIFIWREDVGARRSNGLSADPGRLDRTHNFSLTSGVAKDKLL